jgi:hypothetical protein
MVKRPVSMSFLAVVGVKAERCSNSLVSQRSQSCRKEEISEESYGKHGGRFR